MLTAFLEYSDAENAYTITSESKFVDDWGNKCLDIAIRGVYNPDTVSIIRSERFSIDCRHAYLSFNHCISVLRDFAGMLAYLVEEFKTPVKIREAHVQNVKSHQNVEVVAKIVKYGFPDRTEIWNIASTHSMFLVTAADSDNTTTNTGFVARKEIYLDITARQYGREPGLQDFDAYHCKTSPLACQLKECHVGNEYSKHENMVAQQSAEAIQTEALIRTSNNAIYEVIKEFGGRTTLYSMGDLRFKDVLGRLSSRLQEALRPIITENHKIFISEGSNALGRHMKLMDLCMGEGHQVFSRALQYQS
ncbi:hypothetical protein PTMSG1_05257 [Pyrenophora teres f. maculata]|nr:hypothetical protein PTMSG1_05257 [Pyrenophora teres f. maculata]